MREDFLHYVWQYKKIELSNLHTFQGEPLIILNSGQYLQQSGPDFFNAQIILNDQKWAGNVEIHLKSSDWYLHNHERDIHYDNVILHVVWEHNTPVYRMDNSEIPVLELKTFVNRESLNQYQRLLSKKTWINCENQLPFLNSFVLQKWQERLFFERLERKSVQIAELSKETGNDWEAVLFCLLSKNFGLNTNGESFLKMAKSIPFSVIRKEGYERENLEALFFGLTGMIPDDAEDNYTKDLKNRFEYLSMKHQLQKCQGVALEFFKLRPDNFPTIRLSLLTSLYHGHQNLFSNLIGVADKEDLYRLFDLSVSNYWQTHYRFDKVSSKKVKKFSKSFVDLLIINTIIPIRFAYAQSRGEEVSEDIVFLMSQIAPEKNVVIDKFGSFGIKTENAFETQSLLQLKNEYCNYSKCLQCAVGNEILKRENK